MKKTYYALQNPSFSFWCHALTKEKHQEKVEKAYWNWRGAQPRGSRVTMDAFMVGQRKVKVTVEILED